MTAKATGEAHNPRVVVVDASTLSERDRELKAAARKVETLEKHLEAARAELDRLMSEES